ncbi:hypothetical protein SAY60_002903 [Salmonella enterica]|nr:hypothetical protein [Salmonella enterica]
MTTKVTKESLAENIGRLESYGDLSLSEEYQLKAYHKLEGLIDLQIVGYLFLTQDCGVVFSVSSADAEGLTLIGPVYGEVHL